MQCPLCHTENPPAAASCTKCSTPLPLNDQTLDGAVPSGAPPASTTPRGTSAWSVAVTAPPDAPYAQGEELVGTLLADRYEILALLGQGGMGAVYKARDMEVERFVALKLIRPDLASNPEILRRFKQELILAREVTHRNVIRIFDLGQAKSFKFITMEFVEGRDLRAVLRERGNLPPEEAVRIVAQVCRALGAAHAAGVVHRDLKPQNIMLDAKDRVYVMDFGIAHSLETPGMTQTGALMGTPEYMSPEQAKGIKVDARSDLFALGIIFYEMLTGISPYKADTALATLLKRTQERPQPPAEMDSTIPKTISDVVMKCLEIDRELRFSSAREILEDLGQEMPTSVRTVAPTLPPTAATPKPTVISLFQRYRIWIAAAAVFVLLAALGREKIFIKPQSKPKPVTVLVADFANATAEPLFDGALEPTFNIALEGATFISAYDRGQAHKIAAQLRSGAVNLDEALARLVAEREGINVVVVGSIARQGNHYDISSKAVDALTGRTITISETAAADKNAVLRAIDQLAAHVRTALGDATPESVQLTQAETFTSGSIEAAHEYGLGQDALWEGRYEAAIQHYDKSLKSDPDLGRAYSGLAVASFILGRKQDSLNDYKLALSKIDRMSEREKYRTRGTYYVVTRDTDKAIEELSRLVQIYPADSSGYANLALAYFYRRDMARALKLGRQAVAIYPKNVLQRNNIGLYAMYAGDFDTAIREQQAVLELNPSLAKGFLGIALSQAAEGKLASAYQTYHEMEKQGPGNASTASVGLADLALYESRPSEAIPVLEKGISEDTANKDRDNAAIKLTMLAYAYLLSGKTRDALAAADKALTNSKDDGVLFFSARIYLAAGQESKAIAFANQLTARTERDSQAYGKLIEGETQLRHGKPLEAIKLFKEAQNIADAWLVRFDLGRAYIEAGEFPQADSEFELCLNRRGEATAAFLDEVPTVRLLPEVYYYLGRAQEGLGSPAAAQTYKTFLAIKEKSYKDPLVADARRRVASH
jgi:tetratricopeptide (TPR) repeat protein/predicted Ser/Thr protein kinase